MVYIRSVCFVFHGNMLCEISLKHWFKLMREVWCNMTCLKRRRDCTRMPLCYVLCNSTGQFRASLSHPTWPGSPNSGKFGIAQPQELSQLKVKVQERQDEPQQTQQPVPFNCVPHSAATTKAPTPPPPKPVSAAPSLPLFHSDTGTVSGTDY